MLKLIYFLLLFLFNLLISEQFNLNEINLLKERGNKIKLNLNELNYLNEQIKIGINLNENIKELELNLNNENNKIIKYKNNLLNNLYLKLLKLTEDKEINENEINEKNENKKNEKNEINDKLKIINLNKVSLYAIQRSKKRKYDEQKKLEKENFEKEQLIYVSNTRRLELIDEKIETLRQRAITLELSPQGFSFHSFFSLFLCFFLD